MYAPTAELTTPGQYVAEDVAGHPVFVVVEPDGSLSGYHNVCPHRAGVIVWPGEGIAGNLVCRYHGRALGWDGQLKAARDFGDDPELCPAENSLVGIDTAGRLRPTGPVSRRPSARLRRGARAWRRARRR